MGNSVTRQMYFTLLSILDSVKNPIYSVPRNEQKKKCGAGGALMNCDAKEGCKKAGSACGGECLCKNFVSNSTKVQFKWLETVKMFDAPDIVSGFSDWQPDLVTFAIQDDCLFNKQAQELYVNEKDNVKEAISGFLKQDWAKNSKVYLRTPARMCGKHPSGIRSMENTNQCQRETTDSLRSALSGLRNVKYLDVMKLTEDKCPEYDDVVHSAKSSFAILGELFKDYCNFGGSALDRKFSSFISIS